MKRRQSIRDFLLLTSLLLFPVTLYYLSPYLIILGGTQGILTGSAMVFAAQFLTALIFGRAFCGWLCPAGALQDGCAKVNGKPARGPVWLKYAIWGPWLLGIGLAFIRAGGVKSVDFLFMTDHGISVTDASGYVMYFLVVILIMGISLVFGRRAMCRTICWMAPFMALGDLIRRRLKLPGLYLSTDGGACVGCGACDLNCPMNLSVRGMVRRGDAKNAECILCGRCADACPKKTLSLRFRRCPNGAVSRLNAPNSKNAAIL